MTWCSTGNTPAIPPPPARDHRRSTATSPSKRSTTSPSASCSRSRRRSGPMPLSARLGCIIPKHLFADYKGAKSREAPNNLTPVGTGPYKFVEFKPGDVIRGELNPDYHMPNRPHFDTIEMKGGGDAVSAARAVIQTGEYDYRLEHPGGRRRPAAPGKGRQGQDRLRDRRRHRIHRAELHRSQYRGRRRALLDQDQASAALRSGRAQGAGAAGRPRGRQESHLRPRRTHHGQLPQRPRAVRLQEHHLGIQHRKGDQAAGRCRMESRARTASARRTARS